MPENELSCPNNELPTGVAVSTVTCDSISTKLITDSYRFILYDWMKNTNQSNTHVKDFQYSQTCNAHTGSGGKLVAVK